MCAPQFSPSYHSVTGISAAPVCSASAAGPPMILAGSPKNSTSIPLPVRSRSHSRATRPPVRSRCTALSRPWPLSRAWPPGRDPGRCPANVRRPWPGAGTAHPRGPRRGSRKPRSIPAPGLIQDDGQRTWKLASLLVLERRRTTQQDKPASKPHENQVEQTQRHGRSLCPAATPHLSRQVTAIGRLLAPHRRIAAAHRRGRLLAPRRKTGLAKAFGRWWRDTGGMDDPRLVFWHSFEPGVASFGLAGVITEIGLAVFGADLAALQPDDRRRAVQNLLAEHRPLPIW